MPFQRSWRGIFISERRKLAFASAEMKMAGRAGGGAKALGKTNILDRRRQSSFGGVANLFA